MFSRLLSILLNSKQFVRMEKWSTGTGTTVELWVISMHDKLPLKIDRFPDFLLYICFSFGSLVAPAPQHPTPPSKKGTSKTQII